MEDFKLERVPVDKWEILNSWGAVWLPYFLRYFCLIYITGRRFPVKYVMIEAGNFWKMDWRNGNDNS